LGFDESVIVISGAKGTGKTTAALSYLPPSRVGEVFVHDGEGSSNRLHEQLKARHLAFGHRVNLDDRWNSMDLPGKVDLLQRIRKGNLPWADSKQKDAMAAYWDFILQDIDEHMTPGKFSVYVHDPVDRLEAAMQAWVSANRGAAGWQKLAFGEMWTKGYYPLYRGFLSALRGRGIKVVIFTAHLGNPWTDEGPIPGKVRPKAKPELFLLSQLYLWVVHEPRNADGAPAAIVLKERLGVTEVDQDSDSWIIQRRVPRRIPHFTWDDLQEYLSGRRPCDLSHPAPGESLSADEDEMVSDALSDKQMQLMLLRAETSLEEAKTSTVSVLPSESTGPGIDPAQIITVDLPEAARKLAAEGKSEEEISAALGKPLPLVRRWLA
jgi:hypothetical protein